jgi:hypothetical protein
MSGALARRETEADLYRYIAALAEPANLGPKTGVLHDLKGRR